MRLAKNMAADGVKSDRNRGLPCFVSSFWVPSPLLLVLLLCLQTEENEALSPKKQASGIGFFWHIDSLHFDSNFTTDGDRTDFCWRHARRHAHSNVPVGRFGDYLCDSPQSLVTSVMHFMSEKMGDRADFILWTGNTVPQSPSFPPEARRRLLSEVSDLFRYHFPYTFVYPSLGNLDFYPNPESVARGLRTSRNRKWKRTHAGHDPAVVTPESLDNEKSAKKGNNETDKSPPGPLEKSQSKLTLESVADDWHVWLPPKAIDSLKEGGYYTIELANTRIRLVALNMNLYLSSPEAAGRLPADEWSPDIDPGRAKQTNHSRDELERSWQWLTKVMEEARRKGQNVMIFGHSPPGKFERDYNSDGHHWLDHNFNRRYVRFVRTYSDVIVGQFFGHQHTDTFRLFKDERGKTVSWALLNPSLSPYKRSVQIGRQSFSSNPSVRLYRYDKHSGQILDYAQFYLNLATANANGTPQWRLEYNFTTHYNLPYRAIGVAALDTLVTKLKTNMTWFKSYFRANAVNLEGSWQCDDRCHQVQVCAINNTDYDDYSLCVTNPKALSASAAPLDGVKAHFMNLGLAIVVSVAWYGLYRVE